ncbi:MAG: class I SAM-dependent methyltransferase [bacterium]|nr:class I SAM-dependent methyltransferase [bacterium]
MSDPTSTQSEGYTRRLDTLSNRGWKRLFDVQAPYRRHVRGLELGFTLDLGCGIGRNLVHLGGHGVGIDHNPESVQAAVARGCTAMTPEAFEASQHARPDAFDSLLCAHVVEHMTQDEAVELIARALLYVRPGGKVVLIAPQDAGYRSDETHVEFVDFASLERILARVGAPQERAYSFPFPRVVGRIFPHNEFVAIGRKAARD